MAVPRIDILNVGCCGSAPRRSVFTRVYVADFVCIEKRLVIEVDGRQHADHAKYDNRRTAIIQRLGYRVLRFWDNDVLQKPQSVMQAIYFELGLPSP